MNHFKILRYIAYTIEILVLFILQQTPGIIPSIYGILPTLLIPAICSIAMFESPLCSLFYGVLGGFLLDYSKNCIFGFHALLCGLIYFTVSFLVQDVFRNSFLTALLMSLITITLVLSLQWLFFYVLKGYSSIGYALYRHYLPAILYSFVPVPLLYYFNRGFAYLLREKS